jgi:hypothetical protein
VKESAAPTTIEAAAALIRQVQAMRAVPVAHSRFLAFLLDPCAAHDQGALFLETFLARFGFMMRPIPGLDASSVCTEFAVAGDRLDIVIFLPQFGVLCIENKTWSDEGQEQIRRYQRWMASLPHGPKQLVFLTPDGRDSATAEPGGIPVTAVSYRAIGEWLNAPELVVPPRLRTALDSTSTITHPRVRLLRKLRTSCGNCSIATQNTSKH